MAPPFLSVSNHHWRQLVRYEHSRKALLSEQTTGDYFLMLCHRVLISKQRLQRKHSDNNAVYPDGSDGHDQ